MTEESIYIGINDKGEKINLDLAHANRHGLIAGATGTGKTVTMKVMAEAFSRVGVPVFLCDVKGDVSGIAQEGADSAGMRSWLAWAACMPELQSIELGTGDAEKAAYEKKYGVIRIPQSGKVDLDSVFDE